MLKSEEVYLFISWKQVFIYLNQIEQFKITTSVSKLEKKSCI